MDLGPPAQHTADQVLGNAAVHANIVLGDAAEDIGVLVGADVADGGAVDLPAVVDGRRAGGLAGECLTVGVDHGVTLGVADEERCILGTWY